MKIFRSDSFLSKGEGTQVSYGFFSRQGGVSDGVYEGLNCGFSSHDSQAATAENRERVANEIGVVNDNLLSLYQIHSDIVHYIDKPFTKRPEGDGFVTDQAGIALGVLTADCAPVLFYAEKENKAPIIGAAHAGSKGALGGILESTLRAMQERGADMKTMRVCIGPCISKGSYEVGTDFIEGFIEQSVDAERFFHAAPKDNHALFDLSGYCAWRLSAAGVRDITILDVDTYKNEKQFYSFRRATHKGQEDYGRQISVISIVK